MVDGSSLVLRLDDIVVRPRCRSIEGLQVTLARGQATALVGPPGCGKSLLLRVAGGIARPTAGRVERAGRVAFVFQDGGLVANLTLRENLVLPLCYRGVGLEEAELRAAAALGEMGLEGLEGERPVSLPAELRQLVQLARAAAIEADLLILDDAFARLSEGSIVGVADWIQRGLEGRRFGALLASSRREVVASVASVVIELDGGAA